LDGERLNVRKLNEVEVRKQYQILITNSFVALENLSDDEDINRSWENIKKNIKNSAKESISLHEMKQNKAWFD
jgi:hypothetical protein